MYYLSGLDIEVGNYAWLTQQCEPEIIVTDKWDRPLVLLYNDNLYFAKNKFSGNGYMHPFVLNWRDTSVFTIHRDSVVELVRNALDTKRLPQKSIDALSEWAY